MTEKEKVEALNKAIITFWLSSRTSLAEDMTNRDYIDELVKEAEEAMLEADKLDMEDYNEYDYDDEICYDEEYEKQII